jgi:CRISPR-associated protein Cas6
MLFDVVFPVQGKYLPTDHAYPLYAALSRCIPEFHNPHGSWRFAPITGQPVGGGLLELQRQSVLRVRLPEQDISRVVHLGGKHLDIHGYRALLGSPHVECISPASELRAWLVTFRNNVEPEAFLATAMEQLRARNIQGEPHIPLATSGPYRGQPQRRIIRIKGRSIVGYTLVVQGLSDADSLRLQEEGLGGRTHLGCGFFVPIRRMQR